MKHVEIDLITTKSNLVGFDEGQRYRKLFNLNTRDHLVQDVHIKIPANVIGITSSFILGLFTDSKSVLTKDELLNHYIFVSGYSGLYRQIYHGIERLYSSK